ncbi:MAG: metal ABC transporter permease [Myxococcales bacterium]
MSAAGFADFWAGRDLWALPLLAGVLAAGLLSYLGVFIVLKRMVFVSAALSEVSGVGVAFAFYVGAVAGGIDPHSHAGVPVWLDPTWFSLAFACGSAALFSLRPGHRKLAAETIVGLGYIVASALVLAILNSQRIVQEAHAVGDILFGNAVTVPLPQIVSLALAGLLALLVHAFFFKELVYTSYDPETAAVQGVPVLRYELLLNVSTAVVISVATRAVGALPVFAFSVIPAAAALLLTERMRSTFALSVVIGVVSAAVGYYVSWVWQLPTGASMVVVSAVFLFPGLVRLVGRSAG